MPKQLQNIHWKKYLLLVGGLCSLDIVASLQAHLSLEAGITHLAIVFFGTTGTFLVDAYKKLEAKEKK